MALLLDTRDVDQEARRDAVHDAHARAGVPRHVDLLRQNAVDSTRIEAWMFGSLKMFSPESPGMRVIRDDASGRLAPMIALCVQMRGRAQSIERDRQQQLMPSDLVMVGPTARNEFVTRGATTAIENQLCDAAGVKLVEWIIAERLEGARRDLASPSQSDRTIALISRQWGFKDPSHFSSRFRNAYGISPRELQRHSRRQYRDQF